MLDDYASHIKTLHPLEQQFEYKTTLWYNLDEEYKSRIADKEGKHLKREDIITAYADYYNDKADFLRPFLLTMIWGFASNGYGNYRTNNYINSPSNLKSIKTGIDSIKTNELEKAFKALDSITGLGISYLSKVMYFASKAAEIKEYCLIFDARVARALVKLSTKNQIADFVSVSPSGKFEDYLKYNTYIHKLADTYELEADAIELFLFNLKLK